MGMGEKDSGIPAMQSYPMQGKKYGTPSCFVLQKPGKLRPCGLTVARSATLAVFVFCL